MGTFEDSERKTAKRRAHLGLADDQGEEQEMLAETNIVWTHSAYSCYSHPGARSSDELEFHCPYGGMESDRCGRGLIEPDLERMGWDSEVLHVICRHFDTQSEGLAPWRASYTRETLREMAELTWRVYDAQLPEGETP